MSIDYGIEWAYGEFRIARLKGDRVVESWKSPRSVTDLASLTCAMQEACDHIDVTRGGSVAIAYEDDLHTHEFLEVPPMSRKDLRKYVERHVTSGKPFDGPATFRFHSVKKQERSSSKSQDGILLHLMPSNIVDAVIRICEDFNLTPKLLVPLTEIMSEYVRAKNRTNDAALLLIALFDDRTQMVIASSEGDILFVRELTYPWNAANEQRLATDINRTVGYARQRIGAQIGGAWLLGELASAARDSLEDLIETSLDHDAEATAAEFWMTEVATLPLRLESNFIPTLARSSFSYRTFLRTAVVTCGATWLAAVTFAATVEYNIARHLRDRQSVLLDIERMQEQLVQKDAEIEAMQKQKSTLDLLNVDAFNFPALFLSHLGDLVPDGLVLDSAEVGRLEDGWSIALAGTSDLSLAKVAPQLVTLQDNLTGDPWHARITASWEEAWMQQLDNGSAVANGEVGFEIRGSFQ